MEKCLNKEIKMICYQLLKTKKDNIISAKFSKFNRPYVILFSNEKVYLLGVKTTEKDNLNQTYIN